MWVPKSKRTKKQTQKKEKAPGISTWAQISLKDASDSGADDDPAQLDDPASGSLDQDGAHNDGSEESMAGGHSDGQPSGGNQSGSDDNYCE